MEAKKAKVDVEEANMEVEKVDELSADPLPFARSYQLEALEKAIRQNTIVFLETGSGKTLIAIMLLRSYAYLLQKPSPFVAVFLVPKVVLVTQQAEAVKMHTDLKVGMYWGEMGVDCWDAAIWKQEMDNHEVLVMTPAILLRGLRHSFFKLNMIKLLIIDECHHARGNDSYACIMREFYHSQLKSGICNLPRIFGMTASPIKTKGAKSSSSYWKRIHELETLMNSKVYTCVSESVLAEFIPFSTTKFKYYQHVGIPYALHECMANELKSLQAKHECSLKNLDLDKSLEESIRKKMSKIFNTLIYCLEELGAWLALRAAESLSSNESDFFSWGMLDVYSEKFVKNFILDAFQAFAAYIPSEWTIASNVKADLKAGFLTTKVDCLIESLLEYSNLKDVRCIIFVERVITAVVLQSLLTELLPKYNSWKTKYIAGNNSGLHCQTRKKQNKIVEEFRRGMVNIIVATSILEEGLDVQSCNLVIRFDPSATVCSFIQSRGRARVQNSDYVLMVERGDLSTSSRLESYLKSGDMMREESLRHASSPCSPLKDDLCDEEVYHVESTGAIVTLSSSVGLLYFYCSRLPSDGYFKPAPKCDISKETGSCTLHLPKSCPIQTVCVQGNTKTLKQTACLEACRQLHKVGALTDNLVPDIVVEEAAAQEIGNKIYFDEQPIYFPPELVGQQISMFKYHCYLMELKQSFDHDTPVHNVVLGLRSELESDIGSMGFEFEVDGGILSVTMKYGGVIHLNPEEVLLCRRFQVTIFRVLMKRSLDKLTEILDGLQLRNEIELDYLLLPSNSLPQKSLFDWKTVESVMFPSCDVWNGHENCSMKSTARVIHAKNGLICTCMIKNSLVYTPHNGLVYCITGIFDDLDANSPLRQRDGSFVTYKNYFEKRHGIQLSFVKEPLLKARQMFLVQNYLLGRRKQKAAESSRAYVELPPELCYIIMSPISASTLYTYTFIPSIMHRLESLLIAVNLKKMHLDHCMQNVFIPPMKILEAITTKECQEKFHMESLETLGDSFLKYAASQQLFKTHQNNHEGLLSLKKDKIISNASLRRLGCDRKLLGFIHNVSFDPKTWMVPGENSENCALTAEFLSDTRKIYVKGSRKIKSKRIADTVEALIGAHLSAGGESAALVFMDWIGIKVDFVNIPYKREFVARAERFVNIRRIESLLNYSFNDPSLLVEALTHGSYMLPEISRCYQRLEFLGDSVVDYLITLHLHNKYPGITPGLLTDMRSASVNNECYALSAVKAGLHKHILHASHDLHKHIVATVKNFENLSSESTFGWEFEASFPKVLGDVIESLAGAILVDSGYNKDIVFASIRPLLEPLVTPETLRLHPSRELDHFCRKHNFDMGKLIYSHTDGMAAATVEVKANGITFKKTSTAANKEIAKKLVCKEVLKVLKESVSET